MTMFMTPQERQIEIVRLEELMTKRMNEIAELQDKIRGLVSMDVDNQQGREEMLEQCNYHLWYVYIKQQEILKTFARYKQVMEDVRVIEAAQAARALTAEGREEARLQAEARARKEAEVRKREAAEAIAREIAEEEAYDNQISDVNNIF